jgi:hypothetical protein
MVCLDSRIVDAPPPPPTAVQDSVPVPLVVSAYPEDPGPAGQIYVLFPPDDGGLNVTLLPAVAEFSVHPVVSALSSVNEYLAVICPIAVT